MYVYVYVNVYVYVYGNVYVDVYVYMYVYTQKYLHVDTKVCLSKKKNAFWSSELFFLVSSHSLRWSLFSDII